MSSLLNTWIETIRDQLQSLAQQIQIGCRICGIPHFDGECEGNTMLGIGHLDSQLNPYSPTQHQSHTLPFEVSPHSAFNSFDIDLHSYEFSRDLLSTPSPTQSSEPSLPPILNLSSSETNEEFVLEELSVPMQLETPGQSDEYDEVDEEIEMESPDVEIYTGDSASGGLEEYAPTLRSDLIEPSTQTVDKDVVTRLETSMDFVPPPLPEYSTITKKKTIGSKEGSASWFPYKPSLHHIMTYTSRSDKDSLDQPILTKEVLEVEGFVIPSVEQLPYFEPSPHIGHTLAVICLRLLGMHQYYPLCLLTDARKPLGLPSK